MSDSSPAPRERGPHRRLSAWEAAAHRVLHRLHLDRLRIKLLVFALVATLVPTLTMSYHTYSITREHLNAKIAEELRNASTQTAREVNLWLKERFHETRVFASSYEVTENVEQLARRADAARRLMDYLASVRAKFPDYDELAVLDFEGRRLVPSGTGPLAAHLPPGWVKQLHADESAMGEAYRDPATHRPVLCIAIPIKAGSGRLLGAMVGKLNFETVERTLASFAVGDTGRVHLVDREGRIVASAGPTTGDAPAPHLPAAAVTALAVAPDATASYADARGEPVIGAMRVVSPAGWHVVAQIDRGEAYARLSHQRTVTLGLLAGLVIAVGLAAYVPAGR